MLVRLGPLAGKYVDKLIVRLGAKEDAFEVQDYKASIEILDAKGRRAVYRKRRRLRFLRNHVTSFFDYGWGTGETFASHRVRPGRVVERRKIGLRYRSLVVLPQPQNRGDEMTLEVRRLFKNAYTEHPAWLEAEIGQKTDRLELAVTLPKHKSFKTARLLSRGRLVRTPLTIRPTSGVGERLVVRVRKPRVGELYTLEWDW